MSFTASLLLSVAMTMQPDSGLRLVNPHYVAVDATLSCGDTQHAVRLAPHEIQDLTMQALCAAPLLDASLPLLALETDGEAKQRILGTDETCAPITLPRTMSVPLFGCERGIATASVPLLDGATYAWTAEGATITAGASTNRISATLGEGDSAKLVCVVTHAGCSAEAVGIVAIRKPLIVHELKVPAQVDAAQPVTITWTYEPGASPNTQLLTGDAFAAPVTLESSQRSYTFTPTTTGTRNIELLASYTTSIRPPASHGRRRSVGTTLATATQCPSARATAKMEIRGCALGDLEIVAPDDVEAGSSFFASVEVNAGDAVEWNVKNGTLVSPNFMPQVEIRADDLASNARISARVTHSEDCWRSASMDVNVHPRAVCATNPPTATLSVIGQECYKATIQATFTGTPPFSGRLAGVDFETSSVTMSQVVNAWETTTFQITGFRDSICSGIADNVTVETIRPDAVLTTADGGCATTGKVVATLIGTPPFHGVWHDGETFTTSEHTIEKTNVDSSGTYFIRTLTDAVCGGPASLNRVELESAPRLMLPAEPFCQRPGGVYVVAEMWGGGVAPFTVEWSDGVVTTSNYYYAINRYYTDMASAQLHVVRASDARCEAVVPNPTATIIYRPAPRIDESATTTVTCLGKSGKAALESPLPGATLLWSITNGTITGGQGTDEVTFQGSGWATMTLTVTASYPDGLCADSDSRGILVDGIEGEVSFLKAEPATIAPGGTSTISFRVFGSVRWLQMDVDPHARYSDLKWGQMTCTPDDFCTTHYTDSKGAGTATIGVYYGGDCIADGSTFTNLVIGQ